MYFPIPVCLCSGFLGPVPSSPPPHLWDILGCLFLFFSTLLLISIQTDDETFSCWGLFWLCVLFCGVFFCLWFFFFFLSFLETLLRIFNIHFLLLCLMPLLTVICPWLIILLHSFLGVCILHVLTDGYQIPILLSQSV